MTTPKEITSLSRKKYSSSQSSLLHPHNSHKPSLSASPAERSSPSSKSSITYSSKKKPDPSSPIPPLKLKSTSTANTHDSIGSEMSLPQKPHSLVVPIDIYKRKNAHRQNQRTTIFTQSGQVRTDQFVKKSPHILLPPLHHVITRLKTNLLPFTIGQKVPIFLYQRILFTKCEKS